MADYLPQNSGLWSTTTWITAFGGLSAFAGNNTPPTVIDDVYADGKFITIDINTGVRTLLTSTTPRTGGLSGGGFRINNAVSLSANLSGGNTVCLIFLSADPNSCTLYGNITGSDIVDGAYGLVNSSSGTVNIFGNILGGLRNSTYGLLNNSTGVINLVGSTRGRTPGSNQSGTFNNSTGTINVTGTIIGGGSTANGGIFNNSTGTVNASGVAFGVGFSGPGIYNNSSGTVNFIGASYATGGSGLYNNSTGTINVTGTVGGNLNTNGNGISNVSIGTINVNGTVIGGSGTSMHGINNSSTGRINLLGNAFGGTGTTAYGVLNNAAGYVSISGNVLAGTGSTAYGAFNNATGYLEVNGLAIGNAFGLGSAGINSAPGIFGSQTGTTIIRGLSCGARGQWPTAGNVFIIPQNTSTATLFTSASAAQVLFTSLSTNIVPPASSVRQGTRYNLNDYTGTCVIPSISSVLQNVSVDNSIGIAALQPQTIWNYSVLSATDVNSLGGRLANVATVQSVGQQLTALN